MRTEYTEEKAEELGYEGETAVCPDCGGLMEWCSSCEVYTQICCVDYGTCQCS